MNRYIGLALVLVSACAHAPAPAFPIAPSYHWTKLPAEPFRGKQDDLFFVDPMLGFYVNGSGKIFKTTDGGQHWELKLHQPGTYFRAIGFSDAKHGWAGNIGPDYFPGVTDPQPLYETNDGGEHWSAVSSVQFPPMKGVCGIDVLHVPFINAGVLGDRRVIHLAGRVGGPAVLATSTDDGQHWRLESLGALAGMLLDVKFLDENTGFLCAGTDANIQSSHALILMTRDGGKTWTKQYESSRPFETTWKCSFPTAQVGYATIQNYDPDPNNVQRFVAKTEDGGETWHEVPLVADHKVQEFGIAFATPDLGWVGALRGGYATRDGGRTWTPVEMGRAVNKIRLMPTPTGLRGWAIGTDVYALESGDAPGPTPPAPPVTVTRP